MAAERTNDANRHHMERGASGVMHSVTYELRPVLCGKPHCRKLHGPYWYAFWTCGGKVRTLYIGRDFKLVSEKAPGKLR